MPLTSAYWPVPVACVLRSVLIGHAPSSREKSGSIDTDSAGAWSSSVRSKTAQKRDPRCKNVVDLDQDDQGAADPCRKYHGQQSRAGVERLCDQNASAHEDREVMGVLFPEEVRAQTILETRKQGCPEQDDVEPVFDQCDPEPVVTGQQQGRERHHGHREQKRKVDPDEVPIAAPELTELGALS